MLAYFGLVTYDYDSMSTASLHRSYYLGDSLDRRNLLYATCKLQKLQKAKPAREPKLAVNSPSCNELAVNSFGSVRTTPAARLSCCSRALRGCPLEEGGKLTKSKKG